MNDFQKNINQLASFADEEIVEIGTAKQLTRGPVGSKKENDGGKDKYAPISASVNVYAE